MRREVEQVVRDLRRLGCDVKYTNGGHYRVTTPQGPVFMASTPSDRRAVKNIRAILKRKGVKV